MLEQGITALLTADAILTSIVADRIYPVLLPEVPVLPALTYHIISSLSDYSLDTASTISNRIQFDIYSAQYLDCCNVRTELLRLLDQFVGVLSDGTRVFSCLSSMEFDHFEDGSREFRKTVEFVVQFS